MFAQLVIKLGMPIRIERDELSPYASSSSHVVLYANWKANGRPIGVSFYGAPRESDFGDGIGKGAHELGRRAVELGLRGAPPRGVIE